MQNFVPMRLAICFNDVGTCYVTDTPSSSDGTYYGMMLCVRLHHRPSVRQSGSPSIRRSVFHRFPPFSLFMLWHIELKFCIWLCVNDFQIKLEYCQFTPMFVGVIRLMPLLGLWKSRQIIWYRATANLQWPQIK